MCSAALTEATEERPTAVVLAMTSFTDRSTANPLLPGMILPGRTYGNLDAITDTERRALRPIGLSVHEVAVRTGALLAPLLALPGVRIFQGVRPTAVNVPRIRTRSRPGTA